MAHEKVHVICENLCLEEGMTKEQIENKFATQETVSALASGSPKGTYTDSAALKTANPDTGVYIATGNGHIYSWTKNSTSDPIDLGVYQATGISENDPIITELKSGLSGLANDGTMKVEADWAIGTIENGQYKSNNLYRVATRETIRISKDSVIKISDGYRFGVISIHDDNYSDSGWITDSIKIAKDMDVLIVIAKNPESTEIVTDVNSYTDKISITSKSLLELSKNLSNDLSNHLEADNVNLIDKTKLYEGYLIGYGTGFPVFSSNFYVTDFIPVKDTITYNKTNCNNYYCAYYDSDKDYVGMCSNTNAITSNLDGYVRLTIPKANIDTAIMEIGGDTSSYHDYRETTIDSVAREQISAFTNYVDLPFERGDITNGVDSVSYYRIRTSGIVSLNYPILIAPVKDYRYVIWYYAEDETPIIYDDWFTDSVEIPANVKFRLVVDSVSGNAQKVNVEFLKSKIVISKVVSALDSFKKETLLLVQNPEIRAINHRGYNTEAPENTLPAFILSKKKGFNYVETDVRFTSDDVPVLLHDATIDRTSDGTGAIADMTYSEASQYDFGSWFDEAYVGTKIPKLEEFLVLCKRLNLNCYLEIEAGATLGNIHSVVELVNTYGMKNRVTYISFDYTMLAYVRYYDPTARLLIISNAAYWNGLLPHWRYLKTSQNEVGFDFVSTAVDERLLNVCRENNIPLEVWTINNEEDMLSIDNYVSGVTSDSLKVDEIFKDYYYSTLPDNLES